MKGFFLSGLTLFMAGFSGNMALESFIHDAVFEWHPLAISLIFLAIAKLAMPKDEG